MRVRALRAHGEYQPVPRRMVPHSRTEASTAVYQALKEVVTEYPELRPILEDSLSNGGILTNYEAVNLFLMAIGLRRAKAESRSEEERKCIKSDILGRRFS